MSLKDSANRVIVGLQGAGFKLLVFFFILIWLAVIGDIIYFLIYQSPIV